MSMTDVGSAVVEHVTRRHRGSIALTGLRGPILAIEEVIPGA